MDQGLPQGQSMDNKNIVTISIALLFLIITVFGGIYFFPWNDISWGSLQLSPAETVTVVGESKTQERSQIARFTAGADAVNDNKDVAISEVNSKVEAILASLGTFGIPQADIKTQNLSVNQNQETYYEDGVQKSRPGQWRVSNSLSITVRDVDRAGELATLLTQSGATNVYGPNFTTDDTTTVENDLLGSALENAREKAEIIAQSSGKTLGETLSVVEGSQPVSVFRALEGGGGIGGGGPVQPGTSTVIKSVTATFELK